MLQGSVVGILFFLIHINNVPQGLNSEVKILNDDTSLFNIVSCVNVSILTLNSNLVKMQGWAYQWKLLFNPIKLDKHNKLFSPERKIQPPIHHSFSTILKLSSVKIRSIWDLLLDLYLMNK